MLGPELLQLTWREGKALVWDAAALRLKRTFPFQTVTGEGWGLAHNATHLFATDGSSQLQMWRRPHPDAALPPEPLGAPERQLTVVGPSGRPVRLLNELEWVRGHLLVNVWFDHRIARVDPATGLVLQWYNLRQLLPRTAVASRDNVLNGMAWDDDRELLYVTGKRWPVMYVLRLEPFWEAAG